jgi:hypothetical protein
MMDATKGNTGKNVYHARILLAKEGKVKKYA